MASATTCNSIAVNVATRLAAVAEAMPNAVAIAETLRGRAGKRRYRSVSFQWLDEDSSILAAGLRDLGVEPGVRIALLVRPGIDFVSLVFALLKAGAVQILIDPGMGRRNLVRCLSDARPQGFIAIPLGQAVRTLYGGRFPEARTERHRRPALVLGRRDARRIAVSRARHRQAHPAATTADTPAAIIFTSGSTGPPKGVLYRHGNFDRQVTEIRDFYDIRPGEINVPCFPLFGLFNAAMGVTSVFPAMDFSRPARVDPRNIVAAVNDWQATQSFASPAVWNRVGRYCEQHSVKLPSLHRVLSAGAPVHANILRRMMSCIHPQGDMHTPYGATEALPVASISASEVLETGTVPFLRPDAPGVCVGRPFPGIEWRVIRVDDGPIQSLTDADELPRGEIGELIVRGPVVTTEYVTRVEANATAKIADDGGGWHRMGDVGYLDEQDRFWFCGRMSQRVKTVAGPMFTIPCEAVFNRHPQVFRSALVGIGPPQAQRPAIIVEPHRSDWPRGRRHRKKLIDELRTLGRSVNGTAVIDDVLLRKSLPVDVRHNVKINREYLAQWTAKKLGARRP